MLNPPRRLRTFLWTGVATLLLSTLLPAGAWAQQTPPPELEILGAEFDHATGTLHLQLRADGARDRAIDGLTVLVDDVPRSVVPTDAEGDAPRSVLLAIDVSGSMEGAPISSASQAAASLIQKLADGDSVGVLTFSNAPAVLVPPTSDHALSLGVLPGLAAFGDTALHDAVLLGLQTVQSTDADQPVLVLLSDGEESGVSSATQAEVLNAVSASGVEVFTFALGATADVEFLRLVADASGGTAYEVPDETSLSALFESLGGRLGATLEMSVRAPGLSSTHVVEVRGRIGEDVVRASLTLEVPPASLVIGLPSEAATGEPVELTLDGVPADATLTATLDGERSKGVTLAAGRVLLDPWEIDPGPRILRIEARQSGAVVAEGARALTIAELLPVISVSPASEGSRTFTASLRWQGALAPALVAMVDGAEVARSQDGALTVTPAEDALTLTFIAQAADGVTLVSQPVVVPEATAAGSSAVLLLLGVLLLALLAGGWWLLRRRRQQPAQPVFRPGPVRVTSTRPRPASDPGAERVSAASSTARLVVSDERGEARIVAVGPRPLTVGSAANCDVVLDGGGVRAQHARVSLTPLGALNIHGLGTKSARPYENDLIDQWLTLRPGEEIRIGQWLLRLDNPASHEEAS